MRPLRYSSLRRQSGMTLIVGLIVLLLLTIIGISGMKITSLEGKMAGNDRDQSLAFQAAETALRAGEIQAKALYDAGKLDYFCDGTAGSGNAGDDQNGLFYNPKINDGNCLPCTAGVGAECTIPNPMNTANWASNVSSVPIPAANLLSGTSARYFISYDYFYRNKGADKTMDSYYFTITARGVGAQGSEVVLRSHFGGKIDMGQI